MSAALSDVLLLLLLLHLPPPPRGMIFFGWFKYAWWQLAAEEKTREVKGKGRGKDNIGADQT